jgi:hypothetical protein
MYPADQLGTLYQIADLPETLRVNLPDPGDCDYEGGWQIFTKDEFGNYADDGERWLITNVGGFYWQLSRSTDCLYTYGCLLGDYPLTDGGCVLETNPEQIGCCSPCDPTPIIVEDEFPDTLIVEFDNGVDPVYSATVTRIALCTWTGSDGSGNTYQVNYLENPFCYWNLSINGSGGSIYSEKKSGDQNTPVGTYPDGGGVSE